jgi:hypothetical protein
MNSSRKSVAMIAVVLLAVLTLTASCQAGPILDWLCGRAPNMTAQTSYIPPYVGGPPAVAPPVVTLPATSTAACGGCAPTCGGCAPACGSCAPAYGSCAPACGSCAPQVCQYIPYTSYRTVYAPVAATACQSAPSCSPSSGCPVTMYRPVVVWAQQPRLIPYTTYRPLYSPVALVAYYPVYAACPTPCVSYGGPPAISCGIPSSGCGSCVPAVTAAAPSSPYPLVPSTTATPPFEATPSTPPRTFESPTPTTTNHAGSVPDTTEQKGIYERNLPPEGPILPDNTHNTPADGNQVRSTGVRYGFNKWPPSRSHGPKMPAVGFPGREK